MLSRCGLENDAFLIGLAAVLRIDSFTINTFVHNNHIAGSSPARSRRDTVQWRRRAAFMCILAVG